MTGFKATTHLRFATLELVRGEWRPYDFRLNTVGDVPADGKIDIDAVNIEEHAGREPVNYILPPGVTRIIDSNQSQATQLNEQSMSLKVTDLEPGNSRAVYRHTSLDLRIYNRLQMFVHNEALIDEFNGVNDGDISVFVRLGADMKNNYYEYEIPLEVTPPGKYADRESVWPNANMLDCALEDYDDAFAEYLRLREIRLRDAKAAVATVQKSTDSKQDYEQKKKENAERRAQERKRERAEKRIPELEEEISKLDEELFGSAATDYVRAAEIEKRKAEIEEELLKLYELVY